MQKLLFYLPRFLLKARVRLSKEKLPMLFIEPRWLSSPGGYMRVAPQKGQINIARANLEGEHFSAQKWVFWNLFSSLRFALLASADLNNGIPDWFNRGPKRLFKTSKAQFFLNKILKILGLQIISPGR